MFVYEINRKDSFITHRAFCDALTDESSKLNPSATLNYELINSSSLLNTPQSTGDLTPFPAMLGQDIGAFQLNGHDLIDNNSTNLLSAEIIQSANTTTNMSGASSSSRALKEEKSDNSNTGNMANSMYYNNETGKSQMSATALLQKATLTMGSTRSSSAGMFANGLVFMNNNDIISTMDDLLVSDNRIMMLESNNNENQLHGNLLSRDQENMTRDFLGVGRNSNNMNEINYSRALLQHELDKFGSDDPGMRQYSNNGSSSGEH